MTFVSSYSRVTKQNARWILHILTTAADDLPFITQLQVDKDKVTSGVMGSWLPSVVVSKVTARCLLYSFPCLLPQSSQTFFTPTSQTQQFARHFFPVYHPQGGRVGQSFVVNTFADLAITNIVYHNLGQTWIFFSSDNERHWNRRRYSVFFMYYAFSKE